jgi:hypothetical protein
VADDFDADDAMEKTRRGNRALEKLGKMMSDNDADDAPVPKRDPSKNLGKYLHPKGGVRPADKANRTVDANTAGAKVSQTQ